MKDELLKRQEELTKSFDELAKTREIVIAQLKEIELKMNQLSGAYQEIVRLLGKEKK